MNVADSGSMAAHLDSLGMEEAFSESEAGVILLNTCTVRLDTEYRALSYIGRLSPRKKLDPELKIIVAGCAAQRLGGELKKRFPFVDLVVGARELDNFEELCCSVLKREKPAGEKSFRQITPRAKESPAAAFVTIMKGCNNYCSYCVVPYVRGPERSRPADGIIAEIKAGLALGLREVVLLGQNVNSYKGPSEGGGKEPGFPQLLAEVNKIEGLERIRFMTSHPKDLSPELLACFGRLEKLCEHLHLPLQSGSDKILKAMNRGYTADGYLRLVDRIRAAAPGISLTTDVLTGFPGETEKDLEATLELVARCGFNSVFAYKYSAREGTGAFKITETVTAEEKKRRHLLVRELADKISAEKHARLLGSIQNALVERTEGNICTGRTRSNLKVFFEAPAGRQLNNQLVDVRITRTKINTLEGSYLR